MQPSTTEPQTLLGVGIFQHLEHTARRSVAHLCNSRRYGAQHEIIRNQDDDTDVYFIVSGEVRATIFSRNGKEVTFRDIGPGGIFGDLSAIDAKPRCASVIALQESVVVRMSSADFQQVLRDQPAVAIEVLQRLTQMVRDLSDRVVEFSTLGVNNRIHAELLRVAREYSHHDSEVEIVEPPTHAEIANRVSTRREAVTREIGRLTDLGLLRKRGRTLVLTNIAKLQQMLDDVTDRPD
ncbi:MAG: Crp/Fnr family transcriptional regulator [Chromatiales bacterium]|jgi:CRP/FNR family transcriptional regulator, cyclic AMP receptor protein|nr:Crp/Fnr family transcriptional regulator [Chromatiales bacterium]